MPSSLALTSLLSLLQAVRPARWAPFAAPTLDPTLSPAATVDLAGPLTMLSRTYGLRSSPQQMLDRIQLQEVPTYVASSNGEQEHSELLSQSRHAFDGQVYMVYEDPLRLQQPLDTLVPNPSTTCSSIGHRPLHCG